MRKRITKKRILVLLSLILIGVFALHSGLFDKKTAYAIGDLNVTWGVPDGDPIFVVENMLPGDVEDRDVDVANGGASPRDVGIKGVKTSEVASFAGVLDFVISEDGTDLYGGTSPTGPKTLQEFFDESAGVNGLFLSTVGNGETTTYNFKATFPSPSGNEYQGARVVFDLIIGIVADDMPGDCEDINFTGPTIFGTSGNDNINGTSKSELIITFEGKDKVWAGGGHDCIITKEGNDEVDGQTGNDVIDLGPGDDKVHPSGGTDLIFGREGKDTIDAGSDNDRVFGGEGDDNLEGGSDNDQIFGGDGKDKLYGGSGDDNLFGEANDDELFGGSGNDNLTGGAGNDKAKGESGTDTCDAETETTCEI